MKSFPGIPTTPAFLYPFENFLFLTNTFEGKRLRGKFLLYLKDRGGLTYKEIKKFDIFSDFKFNSLGKMYLGC
jgi:hypothetical protein